MLQLCVPDCPNWRLLEASEIHLTEAYAEVKRLRAEWRIQNECIANQHDTIRELRTSGVRRQDPTEIAKDPAHRAAERITQRMGVLPAHNEKMAEIIREEFDRVFDALMKAKPLVAYHTAERGMT